MEHRESRALATALGMHLCPAQPPQQHRGRSTRTNAQTRLTRLRHVTAGAQHRGLRSLKTCICLQDGVTPILILLRGFWKVLLAWLHVPSPTEIGVRSSSRTTRSRRSREVCAAKLCAGRCMGYSVPRTKLMALKQQAKSPSTEETGTAQRAVHSGLLEGLGPDRETLPRGVLQGGLHLHSVVSRFFSRAASRDCSH